MKSKAFMSMEPMTSQENDGLIQKAYIRGCALQSDPNPPLSFLSKLITLSCYIPCGNHTKQRKEKKNLYSNFTNIWVDPMPRDPIDSTTMAVDQIVGLKWSMQEEKIS